ncbi:MAG: dephospho-CoA kinase [Dehalococcoidales bacterium]|jgi:dephospho-CoA kinase|nr:dephospho-CoA kinase [Dehalococcoidales bacterium]MDP6738338.1 dephospho-CoA kinase [Dehalococcoidales bacterium]|tara:strand:+ start:4212 stop:4817 length:606 start_codon:yes stop_codon:yes gene_type:complete
MVKVIGLTGGIGSGKSTVAQLLVELGAVVIDADELGHEVFPRGTEIWREVLANFGRQILAPGGEIDRTKLGGIVFNNPSALFKLNRIMHPRMYEMVKVRIDEYRRRRVAVLVLEATLLIEAEWTSLVDEVWVIITPEPKVFERLQKQRGLVRKEILARLRSQLPIEERLKHANVVIDNEDGFDELKARVTESWTSLASSIK